MTDFIRPQFTQVVAYEALLNTKDVKAYADEHGVGFDEATEILGREYIQKYHAYCSTYIDGVSTPLTAINKKEEQV